MVFAADTWPAGPVIILKKMTFSGVFYILTFMVFYFYGTIHDFTQSQVILGPLNVYETDWNNISRGPIQH